MAKLKGVRNLERVINNFLLPFDCSCFLGKDFCYYTADSTIEIALVVPESMNKGFLNSVLRHNPTVEADLFLWSLLHELGHHETIDLLTEEEEEEVEEIKRKIEDEELPEYLYYDLPDEAMATEWAVEYVENHIEELSKLWRKIQSAILHFYKLNNVELD